MSKKGKKKMSESRPYTSDSRPMWSGSTELLLRYVEKFAGRTMTKYDALLLLTIVDAVIADTQKDSSHVFS